MPQDRINYMLKLIQVMAWCRQAFSLTHVEQPMTFYLGPNMLVLKSMEEGKLTHLGPVSI